MKACGNKLFKTLGRKVTVPNQIQPVKNLTINFYDQPLQHIFRKKTLRSYANISTNNLRTLTILTVNHLTSTAFEGFPVGRNCSAKTIEGTKKNSCSAIFTVGTGNPYIFVIHRRIPKKIEASRFCSRTIPPPTRAKEI